MIAVVEITWPIWEYRDLTFGDTSSYYLTAIRFAQSLECNIAWSPLYTSFFGAFPWINPSPTFAVIAHRLVIIVILAFLSFEIGRKIMSMPFAWLATVWWISLPITHDTIYEVHLFSVNH